MKPSHFLCLLLCAGTLTACGSVQRAAQRLTGIPAPRQAPAANEYDAAIQRAKLNTMKDILGIEGEAE